MVTRTSQPLKVTVQIIGNNIGVKFRDSLRELGVMHMYERHGKLYSFDIPFQLKASKSGDKIIVVIDKSSLPRKFPPKYLLEVKDHIEASLGMQIQIVEAANIIAVCCRVPKKNILSTAA